MRYLPGTDADRATMLAAIGVDSIEALYEDVPEVARLKGLIDGLPMHQSELAVERALVAMARRIWTAAAPAGSSSARDPIAITCRRRSTI